MYQERPRLKGNKLAAYNHITKEEDRILVIGDLHLPFCLDGYLEHCKKVYSDNNLNKVIFIGDIIDSHAYSYHEPDVNGMSAGDELEAAIEDVKEWYDTFPVADVLIGNHDRLAYRKMTTGGVPKQWIKDYNEVLKTPKWNWCETIVYNDILFEHGEGGQARTKAKNNMMSSVCGHTHTEAYVIWHVGKKFKIFSMQVGCGVDASSYAANYARAFKKQAIGCGVILGNHTAFNSLMDL